MKFAWILLADSLNYRIIIIIQMEVLCRGSEVGGPIGKPEALELLKVSGDQNGGGGGGGGGALRPAAVGGGGESYNCEYNETAEKGPPNIRCLCIEDTFCILTHL